MNVNSIYDKYLSILEVNPTKISVNLELLSYLQFQHLKHIPFQNLHGIKKMGSLIDFNKPDSLLQPVLNKEGGICYNLNYSFYRLLNHLEFACCIISCRLNATDFDHMAIVVFLDVPYLVDVGFGEYFITAPVPIEDGYIHKERSGEYQIRKDNDGYVLERWWLNRDRWIAKYSFSLQPRGLSEFQSRFQSHVEEDMSFRENVIFSRWNEQEKFARLYNQYLTLYDGEEKRRIKIQLKNWR